MQLGLYLPGHSALSGVQSLRILECYWLPALRPVPATPIHRECELEKLVEADDVAMVTLSHASNNRCELLEVRLLAREQRARLEEGNHTTEQVASSANDENQRSIT
jgi:hypothetical protein